MSYHPKGRQLELLEEMRNDPARVWTNHELAAFLQCPLGAVSNVLRQLVANGFTRVQRDGRAYLYTLAAADESAPFHAALWSDGDLDLYGLVQLEDGGMRVKREDLPALRALLEGKPICS